MSVPITDSNNNHLQKLNKLNICTDDGATDALLQELLTSAPAWSDQSCLCASLPGETYWAVASAKVQATRIAGHKRQATSALSIAVRVHAQRNELLAVVIHKFFATGANEPSISRCTLKADQQGQEDSCTLHSTDVNRWDVSHRNFDVRTAHYRGAEMAMDCSTETDVSNGNTVYSARALSNLISPQRRWRHTTTDKLTG